MDIRWFAYPGIDMEKTGEKIRCKVKKSDYSVKDIQKYLHLSCPQPIYRWFKGKVLPTVDHLYALAKLLGIPMEEMLVPTHQAELWMEGYSPDKRRKHLHAYYARLVKILD